MDNSKIKVLFVCLGNICRSPMAETIFRQIVEKNDKTDRFEIDSAGLLDYHKGEKADHRMRSHAQQHGYSITHLSRPVSVEDLEYYDYVIGMDEQNIAGLESLARRETIDKIFRMTDFVKKFSDVKEIPDPYYGGNEGFEQVISLLEDGCQNLFDFFIKK